MGGQGREAPAAGARPSSGSRLAGIEGLRALAATAILVYHVWLYSSPDGQRVARGLLDRLLPDLQFGVTLFFALSGFLLYRVFAAAVLRGGSAPSIAGYLRNRALRIVPAYWVILVLTAFVLKSALVRDGMDIHSGSGFDADLLLRSLLFVQNYDPDTLITGIGPAWTLCVEVVFYLLLPGLGLAAWRAARRTTSRSARRLVALGPAGLLLAVGLSGKVAAARLVPPVAPYEGYLNDWHSVVERSFWCQADLFAFGMVVAVARIEWEDGRLSLPCRGRPLVTAGAIAGYLLTSRATHFGEQLSYSGYNTLMALVCALVIALVVLPSPAAARTPPLVRLLEWRPLVLGGLISYSLFLWHEPLARYMSAHGLTFGGAAGLPVNLVVVGAAAALLSAITYRFVETTALRLKSPTKVPPAHAAPAGSGHDPCLGERP